MIAIDTFAPIYVAAREGCKANVRHCATVVQRMDLVLGFSPEILGNVILHAW